MATTPMQCTTFTASGIVNNVPDNYCNTITADYNGIIEATATHCIDVLKNCSTVNGNINPSVIGNELTSNTLYTSLTPLQQNDNYWTINGTLEIDAGVVLLNKHIYVNPGGQIKITSRWFC